MRDANPRARIKMSSPCSSRRNYQNRTSLPENRSRKSKRAKFFFALVTACLLWPQLTAAQVKQVRRVLIFYELGLSAPAVEVLDQQIRTALQNGPFQIELYREYLETTLFPDPATQQEFRAGYIRKYQNRKPDLIIALGESPLKFMVEVHESAFPEVPIVFGGSEEPLVGHPKLDHHFTGVWERFEPAKTLEAAVRLLPRTRHVVVVGGTSDFDRRLVSLFREKLQGYKDRFDFTYLTDLDMPTLLERLRHLPQNTVVLQTHIGQDAAGTRYVGASQADPLVARAASAPVFGPSDVDFGHGEVGGYLQSFAAEGKFVGDAVLRILKGTRPQDIPIVQGANVYTFDWRALQHWGLKENDLPPNSIVLHREPTVWQAYKWYILGGISLILLQTFLISALLWQRAGRRKAESERSIALDRLRLAVEAGKAVGWDWDVKTGRDRWFGDLQTMFGIPSDNYSGNVEDFRRHIHPEDRERIWQVVAAARKTREPYAAEFRVIRTDGAVRWVRARGRFYYGPSGEPQRMVGMSLDVTDRKSAEEALMNLSGRLLDAQEEERKRIAREIHDDYNQRLALLAIDLENLAADDHATADMKRQLEEFWARVSELGADLHALSHSLHSSTLESLGLVAGVKAFSNEFAGQQGIQVDFSHESVPLGIPGDLALCLFRVVQEGLRNVKRHSGAYRAEVHLEGTKDGIRLTISDKGKGFDPGTNSSHGIGIHSMEERLRILGGKFEISSRPTEGTRIDAWVPFTVSEPVSWAS